VIDAFSTLPELGRALRAREVSSVELTTLFLDRLERHGEALGAVVTITRERALREARAADADLAAGRSQNRPLLGIPYGVKDLLATRGAPTTWGAEPYRTQVIDDDAEVVRKLTDAGAVLVAKLAMVELAGGFGYDHADASFTGPARTPWNTEYWAGGSSSGPAAAVAAGLVPFAIGSETSGSIITPAAFSGVTGFRPTYDAVSRKGAMALTWTMDKLGPMARTAADCNTVFGVIVESSRFPTGRASWVHSDVMARAANRRPARIGVVKDSVARAQPAVRDNFLASVGVLRSLGYPITEVALPDFPYGPTAGVIVDAEGASAFEDLLRDGRAKQLRAVADRTGGYEGAATLAIDYLRAQRVRAKIRAALEVLFEEVDLLVAPSRNTVAYPIGPKFDEVYPESRGGPAIISAMNLLGGPGIALPNGFDEGGLPTSLQINAAPANDMLAMNAAIQFQVATTFHERRPARFST
jgi:aspartyl-tRNA(Asn)/glutamyl-tRNA(Gln) amidotransferase subunit A